MFRKLVRNRTHPIGVITFHYSINYGGVLQAYSLVMFLRKLGFEAGVIDYRPKIARRHYYRMVLFSRTIFGGILRFLKIKRFMNSKLYLSTTVRNKGDLDRLVEGYTWLVSGSDEVWKVNSFRGFDSAFFLDFPFNSLGYVSYAASSGGETFLGETEKKIAFFLSKFQAISVRDELTLEAVKRLVDVPVIKHLDPTLLLDLSYFSRSNALVKVPYAVIYGNLTESESLFARSIADNRDLRLVSVGSLNRHVDDNFLSAGIEEWLSLFEHAEIIISSFFHGVVFGIKFNREVFYFERKDKSYKIKQLIKDLALQVDSFPFVCGAEDSCAYKVAPTKTTDQVISNGKIAAEDYFNSIFGPADKL